MKSILTSLALWLLLGASVQAADPRVSIKTENLDQGGLASLVVESSVRTTAVHLNFFPVGIAPYSIQGLQPGSYVIGLQAQGYHPHSIGLELAANTRTTVYVELRIQTGYLDVQTNAPNAFIEYQGNRLPTGLVELPVGMQTIRIRAFGYEDHTDQVLIRLNSATRYSLELEPASFRVTKAGLNRDLFNPDNAGLLGQVRLGFEVSVDGQASLTIYDDQAKPVYRDALHGFEDWHQGFVWDGRDGSGTRLPDGVYRMELRVRPAYDDSLEAAFRFDSRIDSSLIILPQGMRNGLPGPSLGHASFVPAGHGWYWGSGLLFIARDTGSAPGPVGVHLAMQTGLQLRRLLSAGMQVLIGTEAGSPVFSAGLRAGLPAIGWFSPGLAVQASLPVDRTYQPLSLAAALPLALGTPFLNLNLAPELHMRYGQDLTWVPALSAAFSWSTYGLGMQLSTRLFATAIGQPGFELQLPVQAALDINLMPAAWPLRLNLNTRLDLDPGLRGWQCGIFFEADIH